MLETQLQELHQSDDSSFFLLITLCNSPIHFWVIRTHTSVSIHSEKAKEEQRVEAEQWDESTAWMERLVCLNMGRSFNLNQGKYC